MSDLTVPLQLQLAIPFLAAGDLGKLVAVNRGCRLAVVANYKDRRNCSNAPEKGKTTETVMTIARRGSG